IIVGDVDRDGRLDLVTANKGDFTQNHGGFSVLLGNGDGTFRSALTVLVGAGAPQNNRPTSAALADLNGDGRLDLVLTVANVPATGSFPFRLCSIMPTPSASDES